MEQDGPFRLKAGTVGFPKFGRGGSPFPPRYLAHHTYSEIGNVTAGTSNLFGTERVYRLNSLYDPNFAGVGDYPAYYLEMAALYQKYFVRAVNVDVYTFDPSTDGVVMAALVGPSASTVTLAGMTINECDGRPQADMAFISNTGSQIKRIQRRFLIHELEGTTETQVVGSPSYRALTGANPALSPWLRVACATTGGSTPTISVVVRLTFEVEWSERITQTD